MFAEDLDLFFAEFAVAAAWTPSAGGALQSAKVLFDQPGELALGDTLLIANTCQITYPLGKLVGLDAGEVLTVDGQPCRVRERPRRIEDGRLMQALVSRN